MASTDLDLSQWTDSDDLDTNQQFDNESSSGYGYPTGRSDFPMQPYDNPPVDAWTAVVSAVSLLICVSGLIGNSCVIIVVLRYTKTKTVTNLYIVNLAVADLCFLVGLPFLVATSIMHRWIFGALACRLFFLSTSINWFTSVFTLTVMSIDRYLAVCWPLASLRYRTPLVAKFVCAGVWMLSMLVMVPIALYATTMAHPSHPDRYTCTINWPTNAPATAFIWYGFLLGFAGPVALISVFYALVVLRLRKIGPSRSRNKGSALAKSHVRVTALVLTVIAVYVCCWLPYWVFQVSLSLVTSRSPPRWLLSVFHVITMLSYANSMLNPLLYAAFNENFRNGFARAFGCGASARTCAPARSFTDRHRPTVICGGAAGAGAAAVGGLGGCPGDVDADGAAAADQRDCVEDNEMTSCAVDALTSRRLPAVVKTTTAVTIAESEAETEIGCADDDVIDPTEMEMEIGVGRGRRVDDVTGRPLSGRQVEPLPEVLAEVDREESTDCRTAAERSDLEMDGVLFDFTAATPFQSGIIEETTI